MTYQWNRSNRWWVCITCTTRNGSDVTNQSQGGSQMAFSFFSSHFYFLLLLRDFLRNCSESWQNILKQWCSFWEIPLNNWWRRSGCICLWMSCLYIHRNSQIHYLAGWLCENAPKTAAIWPEWHQKNERERTERREKGGRKIWSHSYVFAMANLNNNGRGIAIFGGNIFPRHCCSFGSPKWKARGNSLADVQVLPLEV